MGIDPEGLRQRVVSRLQAQNGDIDVSVEGPLVLQLVHGNGRTDRVDLQALWQQIDESSARGPTDVDRHVDTYVDRLLEKVTQDGTSRMVVVIKTQAWVDDTGKTTPNVASMALVGDLHAVMAWDGPAGLSYDMGGDLPEDALMDALNNVLSRVDQLVLHGEDPFLLAAGGRFESSMLLAGQVWDELAERVDGDLVCAVPSRDVLLITGTGDPERYVRFKEAVRKPFDDGHDNLLSTQILRWRAGSWVVHDDVELEPIG